MASAASGSIFSRLKYRTVQPVDIPVCHQLELLSYPPEDQASKGTLQHRQHHAAPFFRCVLLKKQSDILEDSALNGLHLTESNDHSNDSDLFKRQSSNEEACHHVHHSNYNHLIGYVCGTRCHDFASSMDLKPTDMKPKDAVDITSLKANGLYPYPLKHEPDGRFLAIHSLVVQPEYRNQGVARALLENYIKSIETFNASADSVKPTITQRGNVIKDKVQKRSTKIEKLILVTKSPLLDFFVSMGFRWRATISLGTKSIYELERDVTSALPYIPPASPVAAALKCALPFLHSQQNNSMEHDCYLVDAFANPRRCGSGNAAAVVVLDEPPSKTIAERQTRMKDEDGQWGVMDEQLNEILSNVVMDEEDEEELAEMRAEVWMHFVAREFHQPATAFVWPISDAPSNPDSDLLENSDFIADQQRLSSRLSVLSDYSEDITVLSSNENSGDDTNYCKTYELHHYIRFYTRSGIEVDMCAHATLGAASILFRRYASEQHQSSNHLLARNKELVLAFHSRKDIILRAKLAPPSSFDESASSYPTPISTPKSSRRVASNHNPSTPLMTGASQVTRLPNIIRIAMDYPWRTVDPVPTDGQAAVIAMLRRAFFGAWSVVSQEDEDNDHETDELAFSLSIHHVLFIGLTKGREDLLIELTVEGFELLSGRSVDYVALKQGWNGYTRGVIVCCEVPEIAANESSIGLRPQNVVRNFTLNDLVNPGGQLDFRSRYFEPKVGVNEDPVSGWPHCLLGPYFGVRRGKKRLIGIQESDRTGLVECILKEEEQKVCIIGSTVTTLRGKLQMQA